MKRPPLVLMPVIAVAMSLSAQSGPPLFSTALPKEEFAARRARVFDRIGDAVAVLQGATETSSYEKFRQANQFYYLTGVPTPRPNVVLDGKTPTITLDLP